MSYLGEKKHFSGKGNILVAWENVVNVLEVALEGDSSSGRER